MTEKVSTKSMVTVVIYILYFFDLFSFFVFVIYFKITCLYLFTTYRRLSHENLDGATAFRSPIFQQYMPLISTPRGK